MDPLKRYYRIAHSARMRYLPRLPRKTLRTIAFTLLVVFFFQYLFAAPSDFSPGSTVRISYGTSTPQIVQELAEARVIAHPTLLKILLRLSGESGGVQTGVYQFELPQNMLTVMRRLVTGDYGLEPVRLTFVEGFTAREAAERIAAALPGISADDFLMRAKPYEGYLFPDTYFFQPSMDAASIITMMRSNFDEKTSSLKEDILASKHSFSDIVVIASLVEREAHDTADRRMVSGILWNRLAIGMPLQVDAVFGYIFDRTTYSPSLADLKTDSPYNTYTHKGLPPGPISNPSLDALEAAANPTKSKYLYYLTGHDGQMRYATTFEEHQSNRRKYLP